ncbi:hypothetical protein A2229_03650 [Candidatus Peregrinibacteria bacterium RIFOXYA2_FULL_33_7]|nr:MAG: ECF subfamily RNA polymerase sigma-24 subunit, RNA polymerase sigma-70 factor, ECF subfamily [Candidatus Peregrinibacteria bacterium GW2011_GWC2_33_13]OGJ50294.1 MAG: hypothetical protein A2229_03650 [Candidatus Peregrinibacteria bacterium RIFOXYA2_FULL_33_7]
MDLQAEKKLVIESQKDPQSFGQLYDYYFPKVYNFVASKVGDREITEDLVSEIFTKILENLPKYQWKGLPFGAWIFKIARNCVFDHYGKSSRLKTVDIDEFHYIKDESPHCEPDKKAINNELKEKVGEVLKKLDKKEAEIISLKFFSELSNKEIAKALALTETNVGVIIYRTLKKIKPDLEFLKAKINTYLSLLVWIFP